MAALACMGLACLGPSGAAIAQVVLESASNAAVTGSGPSGSGPIATPQQITLRHNTDNPSGNAMVARTPAVTVTYTLNNQQFTGLTAADLYTAGTGGNAVFFGGNATGKGNGGPSSAPIYMLLGDLGGATSSMFTSANAATGQGIDATATTGANASIIMAVSSNAIAVQSPSTPTNSRVRMADLVLTFSAPVNDPILHLVGMGAVSSTMNGLPAVLGMSAEFDMITPGLTFSRLSGNANLAVSSSQITSAAANPSANCTTGRGACGSVRVNGTAITSLALRIYLRGDGGISSWSGDPGSFNADGVLIGVSLIEPTPTLTVRKVTAGGVGTFEFVGDNGYTSTSVTTSVAGTPVAGTTRTLAAAGVSTTLTEVATAGYRLSNITCTGLGSGGTATPTYSNTFVFAGNVALSPAATALGSNIVCTFTNQKEPVIRLQKALPQGRVVAGNQFTLTIAGPGAPASISTTGSGSTANGSVTQSGAAIGSTYTLSEAPTGFPMTVMSNYVSSYSCTNALPAGQTPSGSGTSFTVIPVAGDDLTCTFTNAKRPILRLRKALPLGRAQSTDQFELEIFDSLGTGQSLETSGTGTTVNGTVSLDAMAGTVYTLSEFAINTTNLAHYNSTYSCTNALAGGQTPNGSATSFSLTPVAGDDLTCTFTNVVRTADVSVQKMASVPTVVSGQSVQFTLLVSNAGPAAADGAVIRDPASSGLNCVSVTCTAAGSATCPGSPTVGALQSPGLTIPALPSGGSVSLQLTCTVTASGF